MRSARIALVLTVLWPGVALHAQVSPSPEEVPPPEKARAFPCNARTLFVLRGEGLCWDRPSEIGYTVEVTTQAGEPLVTSPGILEAGPCPTLLQAKLDSDLPGGTTLNAKVFLGTRVFAVDDFSTAANATIELMDPARFDRGQLEDTAHSRIQILSRTALTNVGDPGTLTLVEVLEKSRALSATEQTPERIKLHKVDKVFMDDLTTCERTPIVSGGLSGDVAGGMIVALLPGDRLSEGSEGLRLKGLVDAFGQAVEAKGDIVPAKVPKGKEDAFVFAKALFESVDKSQGPKDALALDLKVQPIWQMTDRWMFRPELVASIAKNVPKASNSIRSAFLFSNTTVRRLKDERICLETAEPESCRERWLVAQTRFAGVTLETDRDFDRSNTLVDLRWQPDVRGQYRARESQRIALAAELGKKPEEVAPPRTGYGLDFRIGLEAGASTSRQTIKASTGTATLELDRYDIVRLRPLVHAFYEVGLRGDWQLTFDVSSNLRYLVTKELTAEENPDHALVLREVKGLEPYTEATLALSFDPGQHIALAVTYKNGAEPPAWAEVDKYSVGIVAKY